MASKITHISSSGHLDRILSTSVYVTIDFHAEWCGPCKTIGPIFDSLAAAHARPGKLSFVKVDVDANQDIAKKYGVSAMPTFIVLKGDSVVNSLRGADPSALRRMIVDAAALAEKSVSASFSSAGHVLGSGPAPASASSAFTSATASGSQTSKSAASARATTSSSASASRSSGRVFPMNIRGGDTWYTMLVRFVMLYFTTLFSLDPVAAASASPYRRTA